MIESQNIRQILAIMVTDIVDYTETMNNDEATEELEKSPYHSKNILELSKSYIAENETQKAKENLTKLLNIWGNADEEYIYFQEAKKLWKGINTEKELA